VRTVEFHAFRLPFMTHYIVSDTHCCITLFEWLQVVQQQSHDALRDLVSRIFSDRCDVSFSLYHLWTACHIDLINSQMCNSGPLGCGKQYSFRFVGFDDETVLILRIMTYVTVHPPICPGWYAKICSVFAQFKFITSNEVYMRTWGQLQLNRALSARQVEGYNEGQWH
jgi:hypothetical protein